MDCVRLLIDLPASGALNMAADEVLLESAAAGGGAVLRLYAWEEPTLSLGYFQAAADRVQHAASQNCPLVRRSSGGGAIVHDRELTYSLAMPHRGLHKPSAAELYDLVHESLVATFAQLGLPAVMFRPADGSCAAGRRAGNAEPFLCFQRRSCGDIVSGEAKIVGSAQRRKQRAVLQHGSILLAQSAAAPELPGIQDLAAIQIQREELADRWLPALAARLDCRFIRGELTALEQQQVRQIAAERYGLEEHSHRR
jgi:lipoyl(octanoyl) transferase